MLLRLADNRKLHSGDSSSQSFPQGPPLGVSVEWRMSGCSRHGACNKATPEVQEFHLEAAFDTSFCCGSRTLEAAPSPNELTVHPSRQRDTTAVSKHSGQSRVRRVGGSVGTRGCRGQPAHSEHVCAQKGEEAIFPLNLYAELLSERSPPASLAVRSLYKVVPLRSLLCRADSKVAGVETPFSLTTTA